MIINKIKAFFCILIPILLIYCLNTKFGDVPPVVKFLNPFKGFWQNAESAKITAESAINLPGANEDVDIVFDDRMIPHVFAQNNHDLYYAQGYVTAMHRLW